MQRRRIIFKDGSGNLFATPEFNGDKKEFEFFKMGDICLSNWKDTLKHFEGITTIKEFREANKQAQSYYISNLCPDSNVTIPITEIKNINRVKADEVYFIENGLLTLIKTK